jgi:predicted Zn-dependent peptidase
LTVQITTLTSGLRVASLAMPGIETAAVGLSIDVGSRFEAKPEQGVAHLLEHMVFKGTRRRSARAIAEDIEAVGGYLNAYTARDHTNFYARTLAADLPLGVDLLADLTLNATLSEDETIKEKDVVLQEMGQAFDTPDDIIFDHLSEIAFPDHPLGRAILGTPETLDHLGPAHLRGYLNANYRAGSMVLAAAGKVDHDTLVRLAEAQFAALAAGARPAPQSAAFQAGDKRDERALEQTHVALGLPGLTHTDPEAYAAMVFSTLLGGGMSSRLFQDIREDRGLCYSIYSALTPFADTGMLTLYLGTDPERAGEAVTLTLETTRRAIDTLTESEVARARAQLKAGLFMSLESCSALSEQMGRQLLVYNRVIPTAEIVSKVDAVDVASVKRAAARMVLGQPLAVATVGPAAAVPEQPALAALLA